MKILGIEFSFGNHYLTSPQKTWLVVNTSKIRNYYGSLTTIECCPAHEFKTREAALSYVEDEVAKSDRKNTRIYEEIIWDEPQQTTV